MSAARLIASGMIAMAAVSGISVSGAQALTAGDCGCFAASTAQAAILTSASGRVVVSGSAAPRIGVSGQKLFVGERVAVGANGAAKVSIGSCGLAVQSGQELLLQRVQGGVCASVPGGAVAPGLAAKSSIPTVPLVIGGTALVAGAVALAVSSGEDSPASP
ncbi:hypothetical protein [Kaistia terrae]|uniref:Uncharacterized protein n=1 Tax=Kaistia terrae TaxID=537017 RepID=A0ABW0PVW1_9HYPH|nr:hypothetical protein [Kaistia terrae]MCX5576728.1 hypothetical protein [Kaistia terrae]